MPPSSRSADSELKSSNESVGFERTASLGKEVVIGTEDDLARPDSPSRESSELRRVFAEEPTQLESDRSETTSLEEPRDAIPFAAEDTVPENSFVGESPPFPSTGLSNAELIAARVLSSPGVPDAAVDQVQSSTAFPDPTLSRKAIKHSTDEAAEPSASVKHKDPLEVRITPIATTETTISGPSTDPKSPKNDSKVSAWLKSKFSRHTSKSAKPDIKDTTESNSNNSGGNTPVVAEGSSKYNLGPDKSLVEDVAMAGEELPNGRGKKSIDDDLYAASSSELLKKRQGNTYSPTISLSSGEGGRGRMEFRREDTSSSHGEEFEEARDHFDTENLTPPTVFRDKGRSSDSPVRDSKFLEDL